VRRVVEEFLRGETRWGLLVRQLVMIAAWYHACVTQGAGSGRSMGAKRASYVRTRVGVGSQG
jgi:hypothetical protein